MSSYKVIEGAAMTSLSVKECADVFRKVAPDPVLASRKAEFFAPQTHQDPFAAVSDAEEPTFSVGWNSAQGRSVIMAVYDRGAYRDLVLESSHLSRLQRGQAQTTLNRLILALRDSADPEARSSPRPALDNFGYPEGQAW